MTFTPVFARDVAIPRPMPLVDPVTIAFLLFTMRHSFD
jgi:hypothetical protein